MGFFSGLKTLFGNSKNNSQDTSATTTTAKKVLLVEDDEMLAKAMEMKLQHEGFAIMRASNGQQGLEMLQSFLPDILLVDIMMPVMDGKTMLKHVRDNPQFKSIPAIILTNAGTVENMEEIRMFSGASDFLIKSNVNLDEVVFKIRSLIPNVVPQNSQTTS